MIPQGALPTASLSFQHGDHEATERHGAKRWFGVRISTDLSLQARATKQSSEIHDGNAPSARRSQQGPAAQARLGAFGTAKSSLLTSGSSVLERQQFIGTRVAGGVDDGIFVRERSAAARRDTGSAC